MLKIGLFDNIGGYRFTFHANRPFFYIISEQSTGAIFFIGQFTGPDMASPVVSPFRDAEQEAPTYNLAGQRLSKMQKGINIVGGRKLLVK